MFKADLAGARRPRHNFPTESSQVRRRNETLGEWKVNIEKTMELRTNLRRGPGPPGWRRLGWARVTASSTVTATVTTVASRPA